MSLGAAQAATDAEATRQPSAAAAALVDYAKTLDCIHCGLCLRTCPTYAVTGAESSSPRGRIHLMRAVAEGRQEPDAGYVEELDFCLVCRHCESVCPAGVRFGEMMEHARAAVEPLRPSSLRRRLLRWIGFRVLLPRPWAMKLAASAVRLAQRLGLMRLGARLLGADAKAAAALPRVPARGERRRLSERSAALGARRGTVLFFEGCVMPELFGRVNAATVRTLARLGYEVRVVRGLACCGALHAHNGELAGARSLAEGGVAALEAALAGDPEALVVTNSAGCGAHVKDWGKLFPAGDPWQARAAAVAARTRDFTQLAVTAMRERPSRLALPSGSFPLPLAWDDPCHLCHGQGIRAEPRAILDAIAGARRVELPDAEACCGSAGIYSLLRPADSQAVLAPKLASLHASGAHTLVTANPGCQIQWEAGLRRAGLAIRVAHLAEILDACDPEGE